MKHSEADILKVLDNCCDDFTFPMLDNGYVYLAATRLSLFRDNADWAMTIEVFGFSPRAGLPDTFVYCFGSDLQNRKKPEDYVSQEAYEEYLQNHRFDDQFQAFPIDEGDFQDDEELEMVREGADNLTLRGQRFALPGLDAYAALGIELEESSQIRVFELCRYIADKERAAVLATPEELRKMVKPSMDLILQLDEWNHPDVVDDEKRPRGSEAFQQLARVLVTGDTSNYSPTQAPNTHWSNWPDGGTL